MIFRKNVVNVEGTLCLGFSNLILDSVFGFCQGSAGGSAYLALGNNLNMVVTGVF